MKKCPECNKYSLDFDDYFGRYRCFNPKCRWMTDSSTDRAIKLSEQNKKPLPLDKIFIEELNMQIAAFYDTVNDALIFDFGLNEVTLELPEGNGRMIWLIGKNTRSVTGFVLLGAKKWGVKDIHIIISGKKEIIERKIQEFGLSSISAYIPRILIEKVAVAVKESYSKSQQSSHISKSIDVAVYQALQKFQREYA